MDAPGSSNGSNSSESIGNAHQNDVPITSSCAGGKEPPPENPPIPKQLRSWLLLFSLTVFAVVLFPLYPFDNESLKRRGPPPIPVVSASVQTRDVPIYVSALGSVVSLDTVTVKTQINGQLWRVYFKEGETLKSGDLLAEIDPRPYQAQLLQFEGQLARDEALLANAKLDLERYTTLFKEDAVSKQTLDTQASLVQQYEGDVKSDQGQIEGVKVNLAYCKISSPINGRVGLRLVDPGNIVQTTDTNGIVVINTVQPITVVFPIPEDNLPQVIEQINTGCPLSVEAYDRTQEKLLATGSLLTFDNQIDLSTGTVKLKAIFKNEDNNLFPNQFVNIKLRVNTLRNSITVPMAAIQYGSKGPFVYLINRESNPKKSAKKKLKKDIEKLSVSIKPVSIQVTINDIAAIKGDIMPNQSVVIVGTDKLTEGAEVTVTQDIKSSQATQLSPETWNAAALEMEFFSKNKCFSAKKMQALQFSRKKVLLGEQ